MEFWNSELIEESWELLQESKDIDIAVNIKELQILKRENLQKNENLKKYEIKYGCVDVLICVAYFSRLAISVEDLKKYSARIEGFNVAVPEVLLILKQSAEIERRNSVRWEKDKIDILSLLFFQI